MDKAQTQLHPWGHHSHSRRFRTTELLDHWKDHRNHPRQKRTRATSPDQDPDQSALQTGDQDLSSTGGGGVMKTSRELTFYLLPFYFLIDWTGQVTSYLCP